MSDLLELRKLRVSTSIGITEQERQYPQTLLVSVQFFHPTQSVALSDDITLGIDYALVRDRILLLVATPRATIERFASDIADDLLATFSPQDGLQVCIEKFPFPDAESAVLTISRP